MRCIVFIFMICLYQNALAFSCDEQRPIIQKPIVFDKTRIELTRDYQREHYGIDSDSIEIEPKMIVVHWMSVATLEQSLRSFDSPTLKYRPDLPGLLNVSAHYLVDRDGKIFQLMPDNWMARHVIGLNHYAIGIENVGGVNDNPDLTEEQAQSNAYLVCYLQKKYPKIAYVIGHMDFLDFKNTALWLEKDPNYQAVKHDPGVAFMDRIKQLSQPSSSH